MATPGSRKREEPARSARSRARRNALIVAAIVLAVAAGAFAFLRGGSTSGFGPLTGRWVRLDGGYVLDIRSVAADGKMDAAYLNPKPIDVAKAQATRDGSSVKVFVELQGANYAGSTYTLTYDPKTDQLAGIYNQVVVQQRFDVSFVRMK